MKVNGKDIPEVDLNQLIDDLEIDIDSSIFGTPYSVVKNWNAEQMEHYIETGSAYIPNDSDEEDKEEDIKPRGNNKYGF
jgi:hypothetical protein